MAVPYTYCITHTPSGKRYYGVRYARDCHPEDLWRTYFTSSTSVKRLLETDGKDSFSIEIRKTFVCSVKAREWEHKVLRRLGVPYNLNWLNKYSGIAISYKEISMLMYNKYGAYHSTGVSKFVEKRKQTLINRYGVDNPSKSESVKAKKIAKSLERYGTEHVMQSEEMKQKTKDTLLIRYGVEYISQIPEIKTKVRATNMLRYGGHPLACEEVQTLRRTNFLKNHGVEHQSQLDSVKEQKRQKSMGRYGVEYPTQSEEVKSKTKNTLLEKYGVTNIAQWEGIKLKASQAMSDSWIGRPILTCPKCGVSSKAESNMRAHHFDNCKHENILLLYTEKGMRIFEIAEEVGLDRHTVSSYLKKALK